MRGGGESGGIEVEKLEDLRSESGEIVCNGECTSNDSEGTEIQAQYNENEEVTYLGSTLTECLVETKKFLLIVLRGELEHRDTNNLGCHLAYSVV